MEAGAERLERCLQPLHCVLLLGVVEAFVVHAGDAQDDAQIAAFGEKCRLVPEAVQIDVVAKCGCFFPWNDDFVETQHQSTSTRGMLCLPASYRLLYRSDFARMRRNAGSLFVTHWPKANPPMKTAIPAIRLLKRLNAPTAPI